MISFNDDELSLQIGKYNFRSLLLISSEEWKEKQKTYFSPTLEFSKSLLNFYFTV